MIDKIDNDQLLASAMLSPSTLLLQPRGTQSIFNLMQRLQKTSHSSSPPQSFNSLVKDLHTHKLKTEVGQLLQTLADINKRTAIEVQLLEQTTTNRN